MKWRQQEWEERAGKSWRHRGSLFSNYCPGWQTGEGEKSYEESEDLCRIHNANQGCPTVWKFDANRI